MDTRRLTLALALAVLPLLSACHSSGGSAGTPPGIYCQAKLAQETVCYGYSNLDAAQKEAVSTACTGSLNGTVSGSCPSGQMGCCTTSTAGYDVSECYYVGSASAYESACTAQNGKWSPGIGGTSPGGNDAGAHQDGSSSGPPPSQDAAMYGPPGTCSPGQTECPHGCVDEGSDVNNCGSCGYACPAGPAGTTPSCSAGTCTYACSDPGQTLCGASQGQQGQCVNLQNDMANCGQCGNPCYSSESVLASCQGGICQMSCPAGEALCSGNCLDITSDSNNCGGCGTVCHGGTVCSNGSCGCSAGETNCNGTCVTLSSDANNCGQCGNACGFGAYCENSACVDICAGVLVPCQGTGGAGIYCCPQACGPANSCE
jgi:hypothetical protein